MACQSVGVANPDIAGIGIVVAFAFQAIIAFLISVFGEIVIGVSVPVESSGDKVAETELAVRSAGTQRSHVVAQDLERAVQSLRREALRRVLLVCSDIQTMIGLSLALTGIVQQNSLSLYQYHIIYDTISFVSISNCAAMAFVGPSMRRMITRISLVVVFFILYITFVILFGIRLQHWDDGREGYCYNTSGIASSASHHPTVDQVYLALTCLYMYTAYALVAGMVAPHHVAFPVSSATTRQSTWNVLYAQMPPRVRSHVDNLDDSWNGMLSSLLPGLRGQTTTNIGSWDRLYQKVVKYWPSFSKHEASFRVTGKILTRILRPSIDLSPVLLIAMLQLPLHLYSLIRLRLSNEPLLQEGSSENEWGFGQIYALVSSAAVVTECVRSLVEYLKKRNELVFSWSTPE